ncbi:hypothetical protein TEA_024680 [Camellia sinensis var. sinensis]|uniref:YDG domain-containing protein n=1 Tax=Camellia sinensis var. sinensis TaxID=542762 RepID=A0A4V3WQC1_CAMSN|nr:hypothetical protein TEA_024680 [Camellia sinensis var. sinensis]
MGCRRWGAHLPHVAGIAGQSDYGAQSVALSGDMNMMRIAVSGSSTQEGMFMLILSGGRDLSGNKRTNKSQSFDQKFEKLNVALCVSCRKGIAKIPEVFFCLKESNAVAVRAMLYCLINCFLMAGPIRRNCPLMHQKQEYDMMGLKNVGTKLEFNDDHGDHPRPLPTIKELKNATDITERKGAASWDYDEEKVCWMWKKPAPHSRTQADSAYSGDGKRRCKIPSIQERLLKESLQHQNKKTEDNESSEETDCTCEKSDVVSGDAELCNVNSDILEEDDGKKVNDVDISSVKHEMSSNKKIKETAVDNKFNRTYKRKKPNDGICSTNLDSEVNRIQKAKQQ